MTGRPKCILVFEYSHHTAMFFRNTQERERRFEYLKNITQSFQKTDLRDFFVKFICLNFCELSADIILYQYEILFGSLRNIREDYRNDQVWWSHAFFNK